MQVKINGTVKNVKCEKCQMCCVYMFSFKCLCVLACYIERFFLRNKPAWRGKKKGIDKTFCYVPFAFK